MHYCQFACVISLPCKHSQHRSWVLLGLITAYSKVAVNIPMAAIGCSIYCETDYMLWHTVPTLQLEGQVAGAEPLVQSLQWPVHCLEEVSRFCLRVSLQSPSTISSRHISGTRDTTAPVQLPVDRSSQVVSSGFDRATL